MATLKALPGKIQMINKEGEFLYSQAQGFVEELKKSSSASSPYTVISIIGPQNSGKSYLLNTLFGTNFDVLNDDGKRRQTTQGIWIAKCDKPCMIIMDVEGLDGKKSGQDDTLFEKRSALFSLVLSDVLLLNMWYRDIGREQAGSSGLIKLIFQEMVKSKARKTRVIIVLRDYRYKDYDTSLKNTSIQVVDNMSKIWHEVHPSATGMKMGDYIELSVFGIPSDEKPEEFTKKSNDLANLLCSFDSSGSTLQQKHCVSNFAYSSQEMWNDICNNKGLINAANLKLAESHYACHQIKNDILSSLDQDKEYMNLMSGTSLSVKEFNTKLLSFIESTTVRYEGEARAHDWNIRKEVRDKLNDEILQIFRPTIDDKIANLRKETLDLAKSNVPIQLEEVIEINPSSVIGVIRPYLTKFDEVSSGVHHYYFREVDRNRKELVDGLTTIGEKKGTKVQKKHYAIAGAGIVGLKLLIGTAWALSTGDPSMLISPAVSCVRAIASNSGGDSGEYIDSGGNISDMFSLLNS